MPDSLTADGPRIMSSSSMTEHATASRQCDVCNKTFVRSEHLERHKRIHTNEKPFQCPWCERGFQRSDVRALHVKKSHGDEFNASDLLSRDVAGPRRKRVKQACDLCRRRKLRCDGQNPCRQCRSGSSDCQYHAASDTAARTTQHQRGDPAPEDGASRAETEPQYHADEPLSTPAASGSTATFGVPTFSQGLATTPFLFDFDPDENPAAVQMPPMMANAAGALDTDLGVRNDAENGLLLPEFWQMPLLNGDAWWEDMAFDDEVFTSLRPDPVLEESPTKRYSELMQEYFDRRSRAPAASPNKAASMWFSAPASLADHDPEVVNVFLNLFSRNVPKFFRLFRNLDITAETRPDYVLAAAAVGALYCTTVGSFDFSKAMYNDSRRLLLASSKCAGWYSKTQPSYEEVLTMVKTYILNEMYGFCSGDKRSYEFVEVFHQDLAKALQVLATLYGASDSPAKESDIGGLLESLYILDCYRVCILQRPPSILWRHLAGLRESVAEKETFRRINDLITKVTYPGATVDAAAIEEYSMATLAGLSPFLWRATPLSLAEKDLYMNLLPTSHFVQLAADKWLRSHQNPVKPVAQVLYHLINMVMNTNLLVIQNYAHGPWSSGPSGKDRDPYHAGICRWTRGKHYHIAKWHAERVLERVAQASNVNCKEDMNAAASETRQRTGLPSEVSRGEVDMAHVPYAIYYATLILWCGASALEGTDPLTRTSYLARGRNLLSRQNLRIAALLEHVLRRVEIEREGRSYWS